MKTARANDKNDRMRSDGALPHELRDLDKLVDELAEEFSFAGDRFKRLKKKTAGVIAAWRQREAGYRASHHKSRAYLRGLTKNAIERWIAASEMDDLKSHFRSVWRDDVRPAHGPDSSTKHVALNPTPVEAQGKAPMTAVAAGPNTTVPDASRQGGRL